jgi:hypothetical protein
LVLLVQLGLIELIRGWCDGIKTWNKATICQIGEARQGMDKKSKSRTDILPIV